MASYTQQQHLQKQYRVGSEAATLGSQMSVLAQAKPAIVSASTTNSFTIPTGALSEKINTALNLSSTSLSQQERTDLSKLFSNYNNDASIKQQQNMQRHQLRQHIEDDNVLMKQNASNQMRQAAVMAAVASQHKVRLSATERLAMTAKRPVPPTTTSDGPPSSAQSTRQTTTDGSEASSTPLTGSKSASSLPTLETLLAVQRQLQQHTRQNLNSVPQHQMVNNSDNKTDKQQLQHVAPTQHDTRTILSQQNSEDSLSNIQYQTHAHCKKPLPPSPPKSPSLARVKGAGGLNSTDQQCSVVTSYEEKELPPLPQSVSPSTTCTTTDDSQMNSLESQQSSPPTSLVSIPPPPPPISSYLEQYDEVNSACRQSNSSTPSTIATSDISSVKQFSYVQNRPIELNCPLPNGNYQFQQDRPVCKPKPPTLAPKPTQFDYQRVLQSQTKYFNEKNKLAKNDTEWTNNIDQATKHLDQIESVRRDLCQLQNSLSHSAMAKVATDSDSNESSSASNVSYDISYKPQLNYQQHIFTRTSASLPTLPAPMPPPPPPSFSNQQQTNTISTANNIADNKAVGLDEVDSAFRFPTPPPLDMLLDQDQGDDEDDMKKPPIHQGGYDDEDFQCRIPTPPHQKSMSSVSFQDLHNQTPPQRQSQVYDHRKESPIPPPFESSPPTAALNNNNPAAVQPPALFRQSSHHLQAAQQAQPRRISPLPPPPPPLATNPVSTPQLTVHINNNESGLLSTAAATNANNLHHLHQSSVNHHFNHHNHHHHHHHHHMMLTSLATSSSSPSSSSDGDGQSSNSSSSTSGIHSSIDSPSSSNSKLDDFNYSASKLREPVVRQDSSSSVSCLQTSNLTNNNLKNISTKLTSTTTRQQHQASTGGVTGGEAIAPLAAAQKTTTTIQPATIIKPALKQKKSVSFSDKVELVACAEEQCDDHLPNPLLARVLAGKLQ